MNLDEERKAFEGAWLVPHELNLFEFKENQYFLKTPIEEMEGFDKEDANEVFHSINSGWAMWLKAKAHEAEKLKDCVVVPSNSVTLTCEQLLTVLQYGAPDLHVERTEYSEDQMETEMSIVWLEDGHSGKGYYAYYTELPEEGSINIDLMEEAARVGND